MSFGHFILALSPVIFVMALATATAAIEVISGALAGAIWGFNTMDIHIPFSGGDIQSLPIRPLPPVCSSAIITVPSLHPSLASSLASVLVESIELRLTIL